jgi:hypothetical protein
MGNSRTWAVFRRKLLPISQLQPVEVQTSFKTLFLSQKLYFYHKLAAMMHKWYREFGKA